MKSSTSARKPISTRKQLKRHLNRRLRPVIERSRVLKFGIKGLTFVRGSLVRASELKRWVTGSALRISLRTRRTPRDPRS